ncbi:MAG: flagellar assembly protein FliH [Uliginosibacterium sp.]|jgi:flagellar assembly protein FliH|nr:flagellar assembly protein FliH [Uliginosibacterium sp.]MBK9616718.1 flagellar assembly protein FliH [Uliginosibacterium sp.]
MSEVIPRNQASSAYQRLNFTQFDAPPPTAPDPVADASTLATASDDPLEIAPGVQLPTLDDLERIHQEAHREGYAAGYEEGSARGRMEAAELHQLVQSFDQALGQFDQEVAEEIQALAIEIARQIVRDTLTTKPESVLVVVREALLHMPQQSALIHAHPDDVDIIRKYLVEHYDSIHHRVIEDGSVSQGGCLIEASGAMVDAQIQTRWKRIVENLSRPAAQYLDE